MPPDELRGRVYDDIGAVFYRLNENRRKGVIDDEEHLMAMSHFSNTRQIGNIGIGVAQRLGKDNLRVRLDGALQRLQVVDIDNGVADAAARQRVGDEVERTAIEVVGGYQMVALEQDVLQCIRDGSSTRGDSQSGYAALKGCNTILQHSLRGVGQTSVDVSCIAQAEAVGSMLRVVEDVRGCLIDGHCPCISCGVCTLLAYMKGQRFYMKFLFAHNCIFLMVLCNS